MVWINCGLDSCGLDKHESYQGFELLHIEWGASPPNPPGFMALRATTHSARRSLWIALLWQFVQFNICSIVPVILFRCICPVGIWSIKYLFRYPLAQLTFCSIDFCSTDFLFNWFLFNWHFVQLFCSIVLVQFGLGESTCHRGEQRFRSLMECAKWHKCATNTICIRHDALHDRWPRLSVPCETFTCRVEARFYDLVQVLPSKTY